MHHQFKLLFSKQSLIFHFGVELTSGGFRCRLFLKSGIEDAKKMRRPPRNMARMAPTMIGKGDIVFLFFFFLSSASVGIGVEGS